jgi:hypothetical protein
MNGPIKTCQRSYCVSGKMLAERFARDAPLGGSRIGTIGPALKGTPLSRVESVRQTGRS